MRRNRVLLVAALALWGWAEAARADPITQVVVFGDSLSDVGNTFAVSGKPPAPYFQGRFSNGPLWVEYLSARLGLPAPTPSLLGGNDYAFAGAESGTGFSPKGVPNMLTQVGAYLKSNQPKSGQLFVLWAGANNFFDGQTNPLVPVGDIGTAIGALAAHGAKNFLVPNYANLAQTPYGLANPALQPGLTALTQGYDQALAAELAQLQSSLGIHITPLDTYGLYQKILGSPAAYGFTDVTTDAVDDKNFGAPGYLFWDSVHPTTAGHQLIADAAVAAETPEPTSLALLASGIAGLAAAGWRRRRPARRAPAAAAIAVAVLLLCIPVTSWGQSPAIVPGAANPSEPTQPVSAIAPPMIPDRDTYPAAPAPAAAPAWRLFQESRFDATWLPASGTHGLGITDVELGTTLNVPLAEGWAPLTIAPYAAAHSWSRPAAAPTLPPSLYDLSVEFGWRPRLATWLFADVAVTPGLYTDFRDVGADAFQMRGRGLAIVAFSPQFQVAAGAMYVNRNRTKVLPAGGVIWNPSDETRCFLVFPQPKVSHCFRTVGVFELWGYLSGEFGGGRWQVDRAGTPESLDYTDLRVILGLESVHATGLRGRVEVGYVFSRRVNVANAGPDYNPADTIMLRAGLRY